MSQGDTELQDEYKGKKYHDWYIGKVIENFDPKGLGRVLALIPSVHGDNISNWIEPATPFAGLGAGIFFVPPKNANIRVQFVEGNPRYGIYHCFADDLDLAAIPPTSRPFIKPGDALIRMVTGTKIKFSDTPPGITIETIDGNKIEVNPAGVKVGIAGVPDSPASTPLTFGIEINKAGIITLTGAAISIKAGKISLNSPV